jgi:23S rRNA (cytidine1920-2'-O)/16S rRNA (cytidine1409-2'-O)-methyltransferase
MGSQISKPAKTRLDKLLVERELVSSRERAQALILAGKVLVNEQRVDKAGAQVASDTHLRLLGDDLRYVSRGGLKLEKAIEHWKIDLADKVCLDVGASTGGFTDCMLQHGAQRVIAVDTGYGQMDYRLRNDPRVRLLEKTNARYLTRAEIGEEDIAFVAMDVSFISATLVLPALIQSTFGDRPRVGVGTELPPHQAKTGLAASPRYEPKKLVVLVKPQFEVGRELVGKGGIVRDESAQQGAVDKVWDTLHALGATRTEWIDSPIRGAEGNREFLLYTEFLGSNLSGAAR